MRMREIINIIEGHVRAELVNRLNDPNLSDEDRTDLVDQFGVVDDMEWTPDGGLVIWRAMDVTNDWIKTARAGKTHLGVYWSYQSNTASPYDASHNSGGTLLMQGVLSADLVSWEDIWSLHHVGENEVRLDDGDKVKIIGIWLDGKPLSLQNWLGQTFEA